MLLALGHFNLANEVDVVRDGAEAVDYLYRGGKYAERGGQNPALMLLDLKMPKVNGIEVLRTVKNDPLLQTIPVVVLTSSREESDMVSSYELGANAFVVKPVDFHEFIESVKNLGFFWAIVNEPPPVSRNGGEQLEG